MANVSISLTSDEVFVDTLTMSDGQSFMTFYPSGVSGEVSMYLKGFDRDCVRHARAIAAALIKAADELEAKLPTLEAEGQAAIEAEANASLAAEANASLSASYGQPAIAATDDDEVRF